MHSSLDKKNEEEVVLMKQQDEARFGYCTYISIPYFYVAFPAINERAGTQTRIKSIINHTKDFYSIA